MLLRLDPFSWFTSVFKGGRAHCCALQRVWSRNCDRQAVTSSCAGRGATTSVSRGEKFLWRLAARELHSSKNLLHSRTGVSYFDAVPCAVLLQQAHELLLEMIASRPSLLLLPREGPQFLLHSLAPSCSSFASLPLCSRRSPGLSTKAVGGRSIRARAAACGGWNMEQCQEYGASVRRYPFSHHGVRFE